MHSNKKQILYLLSLSILIFSIAFVSAFSFGDFFKDLFRFDKFTGHATSPAPFAVGDTVEMTAECFVYSDINEYDDISIFLNDGLSGASAQIDMDSKIDSTGERYWHGYWHGGPGASQYGWIAESCLKKTALNTATPQQASIVAKYLFNENSWSGNANEVVDSKANNHGTAKNGAQISNE